MPFIDITKYATHSLQSSLQQKEFGKSGKMRENLHTGSVFRVEEDWTGYTSDFLVYPMKKGVLKKKKLRSCADAKLVDQ